MTDECKRLRKPRRIKYIIIYQILTRDFKNLRFLFIMLNYNQSKFQISKPAFYGFNLFANTKVEVYVNE
jgi:hypothetical protein